MGLLVVLWPVVGAVVFLLCITRYRKALGELKQTGSAQSARYCGDDGVLWNNITRLRWYLETNELTLQLIDSINKSFLVMVAFYFGSRAVENGLEILKGGSGEETRSQTGEKAAAKHRRKQAAGSER